jgi:hypothetical protein
VNQWYSALLFCELAGAGVAAAEAVGNRIRAVDLGGRRGIIQSADEFHGAAVIVFEKYVSSASGQAAAAGRGPRRETRRAGISCAAGEHKEAAGIGRALSDGGGYAHTGIGNGIRYKSSFPRPGDGRNKHARDVAFVSAGAACAGNGVCPGERRGRTGKGSVDSLRRDRG